MVDLYSGVEQVFRSSFGEEEDQSSTAFLLPSRSMPT